MRLLDWVDGAARGTATEVGERGARMSGGQRQRLAIARALLADFPVLILDEPGEHLDTPTADAIVADLLAATRARATLLITHRLAGLAEVDEVLVLDRGRVIERGTHAELLALGGRYAALWQLESGALGRRGAGQRCRRRRRRGGCGLGRRPDAATEDVEGPALVEEHERAGAGPSRSSSRPARSGPRRSC